VQSKSSSFLSGESTVRTVEIICPERKTPIPITEAVAGPLLAAKQKEFDGAIEEFERRRTDDFTAQKDQIIADARTAAVVEADTLIHKAQHEAETAEAAVRAMQQKLTVAQQAQAEALRKERELADRERELNLTIEMRVNDQVSEVKLRAISGKALAEIEGLELPGSEE
jgi:hypothetical protein